MKQITKKEIKNYIELGLATDITNWSFNAINSLLHSIAKDTIAYSCGVYGVTGCIIRDYNTGKLYAVTARNSALFQVL